MRDKILNTPLKILLIIATLTLNIVMSKNGETRFKKCVWPFYNIAK